MQIITLLEAQIGDPLYRGVSLLHEKVKIFQELLLRDLLHQLFGALLSDFHLRHFHLQPENSNKQEFSGEQI